MLVCRPFSPESLFRLLLRLCATLGLLGVVGAAAGRALTQVPEADRQFWITSTLGVAMQLGALFWVAMFVRENRLNLRETFGFRWQGSAAGVALGLLGAAISFGMTLLLIPASQWLMEAVGLTPKPQDAIEALRQTHDLARQATVAVSAVVLAPLFEELLFRGVFYAGLKQAGLPRVALWGSTLFWAATHMNLMTFLPLVFFGLVLCQLYERTGSLIAPITAHAAFNLTNYLWVVLGPAGS